MVVWFGVLRPFLTKREFELLMELPEIAGKTFSRAARGNTTRKRILKKLAEARIIILDNGSPIDLTEMGRAIVKGLYELLENNEER